MEMFLIVLFACLYLLFIFLQARHQVVMERRRFNIRIHSPWRLTIQSFGYGIVGGVLVALLIVGIGVMFRPQDLFGVWIISLLLSLFHIRYVSVAYGGGILSLLAFLSQETSFFNGNVGMVESLGSLGPTGFSAFLGLIQLDGLLAYLQSVELPSLLAMIAILHFVEGVLWIVRAGQERSPLVLPSQRGRVVGGYQLQHYWLIPIFLFIPSMTLTSFTWIPGWWPLFGTLPTSGSFTLYVLPTIVGFSLLSISRHPKTQARQSGGLLLLFSIIIFGFGVGALYMPVIGVIGAVAMVAIHEGYIVWTNHRERKSGSIFTHSKDGLLILDVIPGSPAADLGLKAGEVVQGVNGQRVSSIEEFYQGLQINSAFCKLEVINLAGNVKYVQRSLYEGEHHLLGIIFAPDENKSYPYAKVRMGLIQMLFQKGSRRKGA